MKNVFKIAAALSFVAFLSGCTGTTYNKDKTCGEDYIIHPVVSIPALINACGE